jgi:hypothetical protein
VCQHAPSNTTLLASLELTSKPLITTILLCSLPFYYTAFPVHIAPSLTQPLTLCLQHLPPNHLISAPVPQLSLPHHQCCQLLAHGVFSTISASFVQPRDIYP